MSDRALSDADVEAIAARVADLLGERSGADRSLVSPATLARLLDLSAEWVRDHGVELGGVRMGDGPKARWRFDPVEARERLLALRAPAPVRAPAPRLPQQLRTDGRFPPIQGPRPTRRAA